MGGEWIMGTLDGTVFRAYNMRMGDEKQNPTGGSGSTELLVEERTVLQRPNMYKVILLNDDYTPMEFVVWLLQSVFHKRAEDAHRLMMEVHQTGRGVAGVYPHDIARTKAAQVRVIAEKHEHPLQCVLEVEETS